MGRWVERGEGLLLWTKDAMGDQEWKRKQSGKEIEAARGCKLQETEDEFSRR